MGCIYVATCIKNGKKYVGKTLKGIVKRRKQHEDDARKGVGFIFHRALRKHGLKSFTWNVLYESNSKKELCDLERRAVKEQASKMPLGYNMTDGGEGFSGRKLTKKERQRISLIHKGKKRSEETRRRISEARKGMPSPNKGKKMSEKTKAKLRASRLGKKQTEETKKKLSNHFKGRVSPNKGKKTSEATKKKLSIALKGMKRPPRTPEHCEKLRLARRAQLARKEAEKLCA